MEAVYRPTELGSATAELAGVFRSAIEKAGLTLIVDCPPISEPAYVDTGMWEKVVLNLISNAFKFTFEGEIEVQLSETAGYLELAVRDTGIGIPHDQLPKVFERFHRVSGARGRTLEGSGIGLALVQELVRLHGGSVTVESEFGQGSTFRVVIPAGRDHLPSNRVSAAPTQTLTALGARTSFIEEALRWVDGAAAPGDDSFDNTTAPGALATNFTARPRIIIADDNADVRDYLRRLLEPRYDVEAVPDGLVALAEIAKNKPELVLADVMMPRLDGTQLVARLRSDPETSSLPIILLSARADEESRIEGMEAGADDYLVKPFSARELTARIEALLNLKRLREESTSALRESEVRFARFMAQLPGLAWIKEADGRYVYVNKRAQAAFGRSEIDIRGKTDFEIFPADTAAQFSENDAVACSRETGLQVVETLTHPDGSIHHSLVTKFPIPAAGSSRPLLGGIAIDITEQKRIEKALLENDERLTLAMAAAQMGTWEWNILTNQVTWSTELEAIHGLAPGSFEGSFTAYQSDIHPEDRERTLSTIARTLESGEDHQIEYRIIRPDGSVRWVNGRGRLFRDGSLPIRMIGLCMDVTDRKRTEKARLDSEERLRISSWAAGLGVFEWLIAEDRTIWENERMYEIFGHTREDGTLSHSAFMADYLFPDDLDSVGRALREGMKPDANFHTICRIRRKSDRELRWLEFAGRFELGSDGTPLRLVGVVADVTERRQAGRGVEGTLGSDRSFL